VLRPHGRPAGSGTQDAGLSAIHPAVARPVSRGRVEGCDRTRTRVVPETTFLVLRLHTQTAVAAARHVDGADGLVVQLLGACPRAAGVFDEQVPRAEAATQHARSGVEVAGGQEIMLVGLEGEHLVKHLPLHVEAPHDILVRGHVERVRAAGIEGEPCYGAVVRFQDGDARIVLVPIWREDADVAALVS